MMVDYGNKMEGQRNPSPKTMRKLKPEIIIKGQDFCLMTTDIGTLRRSASWW
ncbi:hypothetical protein [Parasphingorhabdus sp. NYA22]